MCCRNYASITAGPGTIDSSDSVFAESNTWSDESDIQVESPELIRENTFNDSDKSFFIMIQGILICPMHCAVIHNISIMIVNPLDMICHS